MLSMKWPHFTFGPLHKTNDVFFVADEYDCHDSYSKKSKLEVKSQEIDQKWKHTKS